MRAAGSFLVGTWLSLVEHSLGVRGVGSSNLPVPTNHLYLKSWVSGLWNPSLINSPTLNQEKHFDRSRLSRTIEVITLVATRALVAVLSKSQLQVVQTRGSLYVRASHSRFRRPGRRIAFCFGRRLGDGGRCRSRNRRSGSGTLARQPHPPGRNERGKDHEANP